MRGSLGSEDMLAGSHNYKGLFEGKDVHLKLHLSAWNLLASVLIKTCQDVRNKSIKLFRRRLEA